MGAGFKLEKFKYMKEIKVVIRRIIYTVAAGVDSVLGRKTKPVVVCYHEIGAGKSKYCVSLKNFQVQMDYLSVRGDFLVTFDDGDPSIIKTSGVLDERGIRPIIFINAGNINNKLLMFARKKGWIVGSHARTHCDLTRILNRDLEWQLKQSKAELERVSGQTVEFFAYPYGKRNSQTDAAVRRAGYKKAFGTNISPGGDKFVIPRSVVTGDMNLPEFKNSLSPSAFTVRKFIFSLQGIFI
jgi:peptidoglycan/xylan/chitin deacetylase (PgdA/CDA1 family)